MLFATAALVAVSFHLISSAVSQAANSSAEWLDCEDLSSNAPRLSPDATCYFLLVPLDYRNGSAAQARLAIAKLNATGERKGVIFTNPGGPGDSGLEFISSDGQRLMNATGGQYDIVSWDARGIGHSSPGEFDLSFSSNQEARTYWNGTFELDGIEYLGNFTDDNDVANLNVHADVADQKYRQFGQDLVKQYGNALEHVGSVASARDMAALADAFDTPGAPVNFWGFSYGTVLGSYFANLFPDRVGRFILDGVVDVVGLSQNEPFRTTGDVYESSDEAFGALADACAQSGPTGCALTQEGWSGADVLNFTQYTLEVAYNYAKSHPPDTLQSTITSGILRKNLLSLTYGSPSGQLSQGVQQLTAGLLQELSQLTNGSFSLPSQPQTSKRLVSKDLQYQTRENSARAANQALSYSNVVIYCGDSIDSNPDVKMKDVFDQIVNVTKNVSPLFGGVWYQAYYCPFWPVRAVERYTGPFDTKLKNPVLLVGNKADPITPFVGAQRLASAMGSNAVLVEETSFGHTSLAERSECIFDIIRNYLASGTLPSNDGTVCEVDSTFDVFPNVPGNAVSTNTTNGGGGAPTSNAATNIEIGRSWLYMATGVALAVVAQSIVFSS